MVLRTVPKVSGATVRLALAKRQDTGMPGSRVQPLAAMSDLMEDASANSSANPLEIALETSQDLLTEKTQIREALEAEAQEVAQVCDTRPCLRDGSCSFANLCCSQLAVEAAESKQRAKAETLEVGALHSHAQGEDENAWSPCSQTCPACLV
jgi:hypothetical protein